MSFLQGKRILILGVISNKSIAYGIAEAMHKQGAELAFTYQNERFAERVEKLGKACGAKIFIPCDVSSDKEIAETFTELAKHWDKIDGVVHAIAYAPGECLDGDYLSSVTREGFKIAHDVSSYSFSAVAAAALPMMNDGGSFLTMTYAGSERVVTNYNVMGLAKASLEANVRYMAASLGPKNIRVNAVSAGPIRTLAASGIKDFRKMLNFDAKVNPLQRNTTQEDVGNTAAFLCSDLASGITGEIIHVDCGNHAVTVPDLTE